MKIEKSNVESYPGANGNAYSWSKRLYSAIKVEDVNVIAKGGLLDEGVEFEIDPKENGGVIVFSTDVNAVKQADNKLVDWLKKRVKTVANRFTATKKIDKVATLNDLVGWTVGKFLNGRYTAKNGKTFGENSLSVEIVGVDSEKLIDIAEQLCRLFDQESVLVKDYTTGKILFVNGE